MMNVQKNELIIGDGYQGGDDSLEVYIMFISGMS
jgi:hypothetical protein